MDAAVAAPSYATRIGDAARDRDAVLAIWRGNLGDDTRMPAKYGWFYQHAPAGAPLLMLLTADGADVGACSAGRRRMLHDGRAIRGGVLVDLAVLPQHRSLGPAMILQQGLLAASRDSLDVLYGFPNPKAAPVFKRIGYRALGELGRHACVLRHRDYLARRLPAALAATAGALLDGALRLGRALRHPRAWGLRATWRDRVDPRMDTLWQASPKPAGIVAVRDVAHLRWRFDEAPGGGFRYLLLSDPRNDALCAWFATRSDGHTLHVHDFWSRRGNVPAGHQLCALLRAARRAGHAAVSVELSTSVDALAPWSALGFSQRGKRPVFGRWNAGDGAAPPMHLTAGDEDE